jgi:hypothetical protein
VANVCSRISSQNCMRLKQTSCHSEFVLRSLSKLTVRGHEFIEVTQAIRPFRTFHEEIKNWILSHLTFSSFTSPKKESSDWNNRFLQVCGRMILIASQISIHFTQSLTHQSSLSLPNHFPNLIHYLSLFITFLSFSETERFHSQFGNGSNFGFGDLTESGSLVPYVSPLESYLNPRHRLTLWSGCCLSVLLYSLPLCFLWNSRKSNVFRWHRHLNKISNTCSSRT